MASTLDIIERIESHMAERQYLLDCLKVWDAAKQAGYSPDEVRAFSFRPEFLGKDEKLANRRHRQRHGSYKADPYRQDIWHNCVRLTTGELKPIPLVKRPVKPLDNEGAGD